MSNRLRFVISVVAGVLAILSLSAASHPTRADLAQYQNGGPCASLLVRAAEHASVSGDSYNIISDHDSECSIVFFDGSYESSPKRTWLKLSGYGSDCSLQPAWPDAAVSSVTFHGYDAITYQSQLIYDGEANAQDWGMVWCVPTGAATYRFEVETDTHSSVLYGSPADPLPIAEALWAVAGDSLLSPGDAGDSGQSGVPGTSGGTPSTPGTSSGSSVFPIVVVGSFGIPIAGAILGSALATILGLLGRAPIKAAPAGANVVAGIMNTPTRSGRVNEQGLIWSERPWDEAGPGYVTREEYERTRYFLDQGYRWDKSHGWVEPGQVKQSEQWQQANRTAVAREDEQFLRELEKNKAPKTPQQDIRPFDMRLVDFSEDLYGLRDELEKKYYVLNPWQGDPTVIIHKAIILKNLVYDYSAGWYKGVQGLTCGDYVEKSSQTVNELLQKHFPGATVESVVFEERSSQPDANGFMNWLDSRIDDNHNLLRVTLPDGKKLAVDFHQNRAGKAPLIRQWDEAKKVWRDYLGPQEFMERIQYKLGGK